MPTLEQWKVLWTENQKWFTQRPLEFQPVLNIQGTDTESMGLPNDSVFPLILFTTPMALIANISHHINALILLTHRPRLVRPSSERSSSVSVVWHAQYIAGIATNNVFPEALDPLLLASLLIAARKMSHESQQNTIIATLQQISQSAGLITDSEIEFLRAGWSISRYD